MYFCFFCLAGILPRLDAQPVHSLLGQGYPELKTETLEKDSLFWQAATIQWYRHLIEYYYESNPDKNHGLRMREVVHQVIRLNTQQGVMAYSQVRIPLQGELTSWQAHTRLPDGTIRELPDGAYHIVEHPDGQREAIFAFQGAEVGGKVEFMYIQEQAARPSGTFNIQSRIPTKEIRFEFITPEYITLDILHKNIPHANLKAKQGHGQNLKGKRIWQFRATDIAPQNTPKHFRRTDQQRIYYRIAENKIDKSTVLHWQDIGTTYSQLIYPKLSESTQAQLRVALNEALAGLSPQAEEEEKIQTLIQYVRSQYRYLRQGQSPAISELPFVLEHRVANWQGLLRLYAALFWMSRINYQPVLTSDKSQMVMDINFPSWDFIQHILFHFPNQQRFFAPLQPEYAYGMTPPETVGNKALFLNPSGTHGMFWTNIGTIAPQYVVDNQTKAQYLMRIHPEAQQVQLSGNRILGGYKSIRIDKDPLFNRKNADETLSSKDRLKQKKHTEFERYTRKRSDWEQEEYGIWRSSALIERAGQTFLIRIGELLQLSATSPPVACTAQAEAVHLDYPERYVTEIELLIPEGYLIRNLEDLRSKIVFTDHKNTRLGVISTYDLQEGKVILRVEEFYDQAYYPPDKQCDFWRVQEEVWKLKNTILILETH
ncbi:MAG: DUF3857 domain-containing protein [Bernardetiaceae bacterium]